MVRAHYALGRASASSAGMARQGGAALFATHLHFLATMDRKNKGVCACLMCHHQLHPHSLAESFPMKSLLLDSVAWRLAGLAVLLLVIWLVYGAVV